MKQVKVSLDDMDLDLLEVSADDAGHSLSEEIRTRLVRSLGPEERAPPKTGELLEAIVRLTVLVERQTKRPWHTHPAALRVLQDAIVARLERLRGGVKDAEFTLDELPAEDRRVALVGAADQRVWGPALEAIDYRANEGLVDLNDLIPPV